MRPAARDWRRRRRRCTGVPIIAARARRVACSPSDLARAFDLPVNPRLMIHCDTRSQPDWTRRRPPASGVTAAATVRLSGSDSPDLDSERSETLWRYRDQPCVPRRGPITARPAPARGRAPVADAM
jgi:hypothetical protein